MVRHVCLAAEDIQVSRQQFAARPGAHETEPALPVVEPAEARAEVALQAAIFKAVPVTRRHALDAVARSGCRCGLSHINTKSLSACFHDSAGAILIMMIRIREAAVAGSFYPAEPGELRATVDRLLDTAPCRSNDTFDRAIDIRVTRIRRKVEIDAAKPQVIRTVRGAGYIYVPPQEGR